MTGVHLEITGGKTRFLPGEMLQGVVHWELAKTPTFVEVQLTWRTRGKGTEDSAVAVHTRFENPARSDRKEFRLPSPRGPYSFSGKLVSLVWSVVALAHAVDESPHVDLTVSPTGEEILLHKK